MAKRYELTPEQWRRIEVMPPGKAGDPGRSGVENRIFVNGVLWCCARARIGATFPNTMASGKLSTHFTRWAKADVWQHVFCDLIEDPANAYVMPDSALVRAHQQATTKKGA